MFYGSRHNRYIKYHSLARAQQEYIFVPQSLGHFQVGSSYRYRGLIEGLYTL